MAQTLLMKIVSLVLVLMMGMAMAVYLGSIDEAQAQPKDDVCDGECTMEPFYV